MVRRLIAVTVLLALVRGADAKAPRAPATPAAQAAALRKEATRLFRAKKFDAACAKFKQAVAQSPNDPELLLDLAVCFGRVKETEEASKLNHQVIELEAAPARLADPKAARNRRHAYYNLAELGEGGVDAGKKNGEVACFPVDAEAGCAKTFFTCSAAREDGWAARLLTTQVVRLGLDKNIAALEETDAYEYIEAVGDLESPADPLPQKMPRDQSITYLERWEEEPRGEWEGSTGSYGCALIYANACTGLVGLSCSGRSDVNARVRSRAQEYLFDLK